LNITDIDSNTLTEDNKDIKIVFNYIAIGTESNPQYKITGAEIKEATEGNSN